MKSLIVGKGQIGSALYALFSPHHETCIRDLENLPVKGIEVLHVCYPDSDKFSEITRAYIKQYDPDLTIIHSSIGIGKTEECGPHVVYSPVRGRHPKLASDIRIFEKFVFARDEEDLEKAKRYLTKCDLRVRTYQDSPKVGEMLKLISNVHMGLEIAWRQELSRMFKKFEISEMAYQWWEQSYQEGYERSGDSKLMRPIMRPGPIGGHCILPCTEILRKQFDSKILDFIIESNEMKKNEKKGEAYGVA